ncbi:FimV/HubP family polar landmark protein [Photobacterium atrarenae]|uniref:LysM domain-containing protein n=1 Tax=Photobacterium atrarenae TaxID=865757 RepID=A0ABY5GEY6_9GAMM|nr:FimV/HubP family polar landmark protein [Photobacterium atrarenae]UTV26953.1 hypothetical protein NNL38_11420 [Photobacterium atrarenae]
MSDLSTMIKRFILPVIIAGAAFQIPVQANTVRIVGPSEDDVRTVQSEPAQSFSSSQNTINRYGPTGNSETLWSIASRYRPNNQVSVYQVIGAIHRANPMAFEQNNIHGLIPGSVLTMPTLAQIRREDVDSVRRRLEADQRRQVRQSVPPSSPASRAASPAPTVVATAQPKPQVAIDEQQIQASPKPATASAPAASETAGEVSADKGGIPAKPTALQTQLDASDVQMTKLVESNHLLRVRLAEMQHEVSALKDQITNDERLRKEILDFIQHQKSQPVEPAVAETSWVDDLVANPWALAAAAFVPGALIAGAIAFFMMRRKEDDDEVKALDSPQAQDPAIPAPSEGEPDAIAALDGEKSDADDLFAVDDDSLFDDPETSLFGPEHDGDKPAESDDLLDLSAGGHDDFEIESGLTPSSISVKGDEEAIGLQDMERALDEIEQSSEPSSDEALAAMWEQSLQGDDDDNDSFDLADADSAVDSEQDIEDGLLDQSILDDLLSEAGDLAEEPSAPEAAPAELEPAAAAEPERSQVADQDELDALFNSVGLAEEPSPAAVEADAPEEQAQQAAVDQALADADALFDENSTALLDELVEDEAISAPEIELEENSTALLDELIGDEDDPLNRADITLDENSTALLDELVADEEDSNVGVADLDVEDEPALNLDDVVIDENSTDLLDDILEQQQHPASMSTSEAAGELSVDEFDSSDASTAKPSQAEPATPAETEADVSLFDDPEFEPTEAQSTAPSDDASQDADFVAADESDFADALNDALNEQPTETTADVPADDIDALLADVQELVNEPEFDEDVALAEAFADETPAQEVEPELENDPELGLDAFDKPESDAAPELSLASPEEPEADAPLNLEDLPEFDEDAALAETFADEAPTQEAEPELENDPELGLDAFDEPESDAAPELSLASPEEPEADAPLNLEDLPEFDEDAALAETFADEAPTQEAEPELENDPELGLDAFDEPESDAAPELSLASPEEPEADAPLNLEDLPEFDEDAALAEAFADETPVQEAEPELENDPELGLDAFDAPEPDAAPSVESIPDQAELEPEQEPAHAPEQELNETSAPVVEPELEQTPAPQVAQEEVSPQPQHSIHGVQNIEFETIDPASIAEFSEDDALQASFDEQMELDQYAPGVEASDVETAPEPAPQPRQQTPQYHSQPPADMFDDELVDTAGLDMDALLSDPDDSFAGMDVATVDSLLAEQDEARTEAQASAEAAVADVASQAESELAEEASAQTPEPASSIAESQPAPEADRASAPDEQDEQDELDELDAERDQLWSSGLDDDNLASEAYPEEDAEIWRASNPEPELETEDWAEQPQMMIDDVAAFDPEMLLAEADSEVLTDEAGGSELVTEPEPAPAYISIDELMKDMEAEEASEEIEEQPLDLNVGLDEFPDILNDVAEVDVDSQGEYASKLDLAKAYLEMNDREGAQGLLEDIAGNGDVQSRQEAQALLQKISR